MIFTCGALKRGITVYGRVRGAGEGPRSLFASSRGQQYRCFNTLKSALLSTDRQDRVLCNPKSYAQMSPGSLGSPRHVSSPW
jgi:hypothetical protein